jgi:hypothetical protein
MKQFTFVKLSGRWFVDIEYQGSITDLEMVDGSDTFLESFADGSRVVHVFIPEEDKDYIDYTFENNCWKTFLTKKAQDKDGTTYEADSNRYRGDIWLCPVFNMLMGESPDKLYVGIMSDI